MNGDNFKYGNNRLVNLKVLGPSWVFRAGVVVVPTSSMAPLPASPVASALLPQ